MSTPDVAEIDTVYWLHSRRAVCAAAGCLPGIVSLIVYLPSSRSS